MERLASFGSEYRRAGRCLSWGGRQQQRRLIPQTLSCMRTAVIAGGSDLASVRFLLLKLQFRKNMA